MSYFLSWQVAGWGQFSVTIFRFFAVFGGRGVSPFSLQGMFSPISQFSWSLVGMLDIAPLVSLGIEHSVRVAGWGCACSFPILHFVIGVANGHPIGVPFRVSTCFDLPLPWALKKKLEGGGCTPVLH